MSAEETALISWEDAGISNNFIFRLAMDDTDICQEQLEILLGTKVAKIDFKEHEKEYEHDKFQKGKREGLTPQQIAFLDYVDGKGASDEFTKKLDERVQFVKMDSGKKADFMTWQQELIEQQEIGKEIGKFESTIKSIKKMMQNLQLTADEAMKALEIPSNEYPIYLKALNS